MSDAAVQEAPATAACPGCGTTLPDTLLACPSCHRLVHGDKLKRFSAQAERMSAAGRLTAALAEWRKALELLPPETRQHQAIVARIAALRERVDAPGYVEAAATDADESAGPGAAPAPATDGGGNAGQKSTVLGVLGIAVWKFKFFLLSMAGKIKFLLLGISKGSTLLSMLVYLGPCWARWGWQFALGLVLSIYIHEMGHVAALTRYGMNATAPMFIPGVGALIRLNQYPSDAIEDSRIGLAGPIWGFAAALGFYLLGLATGNELFAAVAKTGAWINLFNLVPFWQLDGGRGFRAMRRSYRVLAVLATAIVLAVTHEGLLALICVAGTMRVLSADCPKTGGERALGEYLFLVLALSALNAVPISMQI